MDDLRGNRTDRTRSPHQGGERPGHARDRPAHRARTAPRESARPSRAAPEADPRRARAAQTEDPRRTLGRLGEEIAADHLRKRGFEILERNVRTASGEIDLIVTDGARLVFVEVKCRRARQPSSGEAADTSWALEAIGPGKRARLRRLAAEWLRRSVTGRPFTDEIRFDAIAVLVERSGRLLRLDHLEGAF